MFYCVVKNVDGRKSYRYFKKFQSAELAMMDDIASCRRSFSFVRAESIDGMNTDKGFYEREEKRFTKEGYKFHWAIINCYFEDENDE